MEQTVEMDRLRWVTVTLCSYEVTAILVKHVTKKNTIPTITHMSKSQRWIGLALTCAMGYHFATAK